MTSADDECGAACVGAGADVVLLASRAGSGSAEAAGLSAAGVYRVVEDKLDGTLQNQPALVRLDGDTLRIEALKA